MHSGAGRRRRCGDPVGSAGTTPYWHAIANSSANLRIDKLVIEVAETRNVVRCPACGHKTREVHEIRRVRDIALGRPTSLVWRQRLRVRQLRGRHTEDHPELESKLSVAPRRARTEIP